MRSTNRAHGCSSASARLDRQPDRTDDRRIQFRPVAELARKAEDWEFPGLLLADSQDLNADIWSNSAWPARRPRGCSSARTCPCRRRRGGRRLALTAGLPRDGAPGTSAVPLPPTPSRRTVTERSASRSTLSMTRKAWSATCTRATSPPSCDTCRRTRGAVGHVHGHHPSSERRRARGRRDDRDARGRGMRFEIDKALSSALPHRSSASNATNGNRPGKG
jgi:hypothetical protein